MATLTHDEAQKVKHYEDLEARRRAGEHVSDFALENARQIADNQQRNAEARERRQAQLQAEEDAKYAANQARLDAAAQVAADAFLREARARYAGTQAEWEQDRPEILRQWRIRNAVGGGELDALIEQKRRQYGDMF